MERESGFSLIELLIVVAIILIIAAIAIPNLLRARIAANESSAAASSRTVATAELSYATAYPTVGYPLLIATLGPAMPADPGCGAGAVVGNACIIDGTLGTGTKSGYTFTAVGSIPNAAGANTAYVTNAVPQNANVTGVKSFCGIEDNVVRFFTPSNGVRTHANCATTDAPIGN